MWVVLATSYSFSDGGGRSKFHTLTVLVEHIHEDVRSGGYDALEDDLNLTFINSGDFKWRHASNLQNPDEEGNKIHTLNTSSNDCWNQRIFGTDEFGPIEI